MKDLIAHIFLEVVYAQSPTDPLVPDCGQNNLCTNWEQLFELFNRVLNWFIWAAVPAAVIALAYAGWLFMWEGTNSGSVSQGKKILKSSVIGLVVVLAAALIVKTILAFLLDPTKPEFQNIIQGQKL